MGSSGGVGAALAAVTVGRRLKPPLQFALTDLSAGSVGRRLKPPLQFALTDLCGGKRGPAAEAAPTDLCGGKGIEFHRHAISQGRWLATNHPAVCAPCPLAAFAGKRDADVLALLHGSF